MIIATPEHERVQARLVEVDGHASPGEVVDGWLRGDVVRTWYGLRSLILEIRVLPGEARNDTAQRFNDILDSMPFCPTYDEQGCHLVDQALRAALSRTAEHRDRVHHR